uniref:Uncharacterized protein n=1 Tax=Oryzias melastigma TaxID=30732 RepID=A0A3B3BL95_ORYME
MSSEVIVYKCYIQSYRVTSEVCPKTVIFPPFPAEGALPPNLHRPECSTSSIRALLMDLFSSGRPPPPAECSLPLQRRCDAVVPAHLSPTQTWVESLQVEDGEPLSSTRTSLDRCSIEKWQRKYKRISHAHTKVRQKGSGKSHHGSPSNSHICSSGGVSQGPRGPTSYYYMFSMMVQVQRLKVALSSKMVHIDNKLCRFLHRCLPEDILFAEHYPQNAQNKTQKFDPL